MSKQPELTPWFDGTVKPVRVGLYQRLMFPGFRHVYAWWDGKRWSAASIFKTEALVLKGSYARNQIHAQWRGLAQDPLVTT